MENVQKLSELLESLAYSAAQVAFKTFSQMLFVTILIVDCVMTFKYNEQYMRRVNVVK